MSKLLEYIRTIIILCIGFSVLGYIENEISISIGIIDINSFKVWLLTGISNFLFLFVLYRNKLQFSGWYSGEQNVRLSRKTTTILILVATALLFTTPFL
ncbi:hypothetical protein NDK47_22695 [Brevibacillus ruminantium]|uniref:Uncharacterized protein n=1 Tax=Brevibacillus ruminantium TaxID=2950604 RepID=A0ABY4WJS2_9BACL|nr:hypothetical protein [Brevibacillus ruminantium]USG64901.1 hypothetical protein NDK47_22695 [Brevibacillus ruminantium]